MNFPGSWTNGFKIIKKQEGMMEDKIIIIIISVKRKPKKIY